MSTTQQHRVTAQEIHASLGYCYLSLFDDICRQLRMGGVARFRIRNRVGEVLGRFPAVPSLLRYLGIFLPYAQRIKVSSLFHVGGQTLHYPGRKTMMLADFVEYYSCFRGFCVGAESNRLQPGKLMQELGVSPADVTTNALKSVVPMEAATNLVAATIAGEVDKCARIHRADRKVIIPFRPTTTIRRIIETSYDHYNIEFAGGMAQHEYAAASRILEIEEIFARLNYSNNKAPRGFDVHVVDVGGNWMTHFDRGRQYVHCDSPILGANDARRASERLTRLRMRQRATATQVKILSKCVNNTDVLDCKGSLFCLNTGSKCTVTAPACMFVHSTYDMSCREIADTMDAHRSYVAYGTFIFNANILASLDVDTTGHIDVYDARWRIEVVNKEKYIRFSFVNDSSYHYSHKLKDYLEFVTRQHLVSSRGVSYMVEMLNNVNSTQYFKLTRVDISTLSPELMHHSWWLPSDDSVCVTYYVLDDTVFRFGVRRLLKKTMIVSSTFLAPLMQYAARASDAKFTISDIYSYACAMSSRVIINGTTVVARNTDFARDVNFQLLDLVQFVYVRTFEQKYNSGLVVKEILDEIKSERARQSGILATIWDLARKRLEHQLEGWKCSITNFFLGSVVQRRYCMDYGVVDRQVTFSSLVQIGNTLDERHSGVTHQDIDAVADVNSVYFSEPAIQAEMQGGTKTHVLRGTGRGTCLEPHKELVRCNVPGDGDCQFHAIAITTQLWEDGPAVRQEFITCADAPRCILEGDQGDDESLAYIAQARKIRFCVHMEGSVAKYELVRTFGEQGQVYHMIYNGSHYDALLSPAELNLNKEKVGPVLVETSAGGPPHSVLNYVDPNYFGIRAATWLRDEKNEVVRRVIRFRTQMLKKFCKWARKDTTEISERQLFSAITAADFRVMCGNKVYSHHYERPVYQQTLRWNQHEEYAREFGDVPASDQKKSERLYMLDFLRVANDIVGITEKYLVKRPVVQTVHRKPVRETETPETPEPQAPVVPVQAPAVTEQTESVAPQRSHMEEKDTPGTSVSRQRSLSVCSSASSASTDTVLSRNTLRVPALREEVRTFTDEQIRAVLADYWNVSNQFVDIQHAAVSDLLSELILSAHRALDLSNGRGGSALALLTSADNVSAVHDLMTQHSACVDPKITHMQVTGTNDVLEEGFKTNCFKSCSSTSLVLYDFVPTVEMVPLEGELLPRLSVVAEIALRVLREGGTLILKFYDLISTDARALVKHLGSSFEQVTYHPSAIYPASLGVIYVVFHGRLPTLSLSGGKSLGRELRERVRALSASTLVQLTDVLQRLQNSDQPSVQKMVGGGPREHLNVVKSGIKCRDPGNLQDRGDVIPICPELYRFCQTDRIGVSVKETAPPGLGIVAVAKKAFKVDLRQHLLLIHFKNTDQLLNYIQEFFVDMNVEVSVVGVTAEAFPEVTANHYTVYLDQRNVTTTHACVAGGGLEWYWSQTEAYKKYWDKADGEYEVDFSIPPSREVYCRNAVRECREQWYISLKNIGQKYSVFYEWHITNQLHVSPDRLRGIHKLCQDSGEDFGIIKDGKFLIRPQEIEFYEKAYNGSNFIDLQYPSKDPMHPVGDGSEYLLVGKSSKLMQCAAMLKATVGLEPYATYIPSITLRNGVPGCGKTKHIIDNATEEDFILTTTRENRQDIMTRCPTMRSRVKTVHSVILNPGQFGKVRKLFIDEALMSHAGEILMAVSILQPEQVEMSGDVNQIPFINRAAAIVMKFEDAARICDVVTHANTSYRVPMDVAALFKSSYEQGFTTKNNICTSLDYIEVNGFNDLPKNIPVLVFKQQEKTMLRLEGYDVSTVHEYQGKQAKEISLYRHSVIPSDQIYMSDPHILVALTRHTDKLVYYTRLIDKTCKMIQMAKEMTTKEVRSMVGGGPPCVMMPNFAYSGPDYSKVVNFGLAIDLPRYRLFRSVKEVLRPKHTKIRLNHVTPQVHLLQQWYDTILPRVSTVDRTYDNYMIHNDPLSVSIAGKVVLDLTKIGAEARKFDYMRPVLRTGMGLERMRTQRESLLAYIKRNDAVPIPVEPVDPKFVVTLMMEKFRGYFDLERLAGVQAPIELNSESMQLWAQAQDKSVDLSLDKYLHEFDLGKYEYMIKPRPKPDLTKQTTTSYAALQTIAYQPNQINQLLCPLFKDLKERVLFCLHERFKIFSDVTVAEFADRITDIFPAGFDPASTIYEFDISKFDKSQNEIALMLDVEIMRMFGVSEAITQLWLNAHTATELIDYKGGLKTDVVFQRKSGDPFTFLGNTLFLMACLAVIVPLEHIEFAAFGGDDQIIVTKWDIGLSTVQYLENVFNLEAKLFKRQYPYFCSKFLIHSGERWYFLPDILKLVTKLGRHDLRNFQHVEEYRVSLNDLMNVYRDCAMLPVFNEAFNERYPSTIVDHTYVIETIVMLCSRSAAFRTLYYSRPDDVLCHDPLRPNIKDM